MATCEYARLACEPARRASLQARVLLLRLLHSDPRFLGALLQDKRVVLTVCGPWPGWYFGEINEPPVGYVGVRHAEKIANRGRNIQAGAFVEIRFGTLVAEDVIRVVRPKRPTVLPLRIRHPIAKTDGDPAALEHASARHLKRFLEPW